MSPADVRALEAEHGHRRFALVGDSSEPQAPPAVAHMDGNPQALVTELLRLARLGADLSAEAERQPRRRLAPVVEEFSGFRVTRLRKYRGARR